MSKKNQHQTFQIKVKKHLPLGLFIELENGHHGIVRIRETSWDPDLVRNWRNNFPVGWQGEATPIATRKGEYREFSLRMAESDPWDDLLHEIKKGDIFDGIVTGVVSYGAFIDIDEGMTGLLHKSELSSAIQASPLDLFWPGDHVRVRLKKVDSDARRISLGLAPAQTPDLTNSPSIIQIRSSTRSNGDNAPDAFALTSIVSTHILLVEDEPAQSEAMSIWLTRIGQRVDVVGNAEKALEYLESTEPDMAMLDVCLPGMQGDELAWKILERWPKIHLVLTTDWARADSLEIEELQNQGVELLIKPLMPADLAWVLHRGETQTEDADIEFDEVKPVGQVLSNTPTFKPNSSLSGLLQRCQTYLEFDGAVLFALDPAQRSIFIVEQSGDVYCNKATSASLVFSPVRDVAEGKKSVIAKQITGTEESRFKYLLDFCPEIDACLAVPVPAKLQFDYALFLLHKYPRPISAEQKIYAEASALALGAILEQEYFREKSAHLQRTTLIGHLTRSMVHEINNLIGPLSLRVENLRAGLEKIEADPNDVISKEKINRLIAGEAGEIQASVRRITNNTRMFGRIVAQKKNEHLRVDELISETVALLREISNKAHVNILFTPPEQLIIIRNQAAALEQILLNVMLNAVQQIDEFRQKQSGWVHVWVETFVDNSNENWFRIAIKDNGPGIHANLNEKIFEAGFTTRTDGSGIGLYLSRNIVEELGGKLYVAESFILSGTTFVLELPLSI